MIADQPIELRQLPLGNGPQGTAEIGDRGIRKAVMDEQALLPAVNEGRPPERRATQV